MTDGPKQPGGLSLSFIPFRNPCSDPRVNQSGSVGGEEEQFTRFHVQGVESGCVGGSWDFVISYQQCFS